MKIGRLEINYRKEKPALNFPIKVDATKIRLGEHISIIKCDTKEFINKTGTVRGVMIEDLNSSEIGLAIFLDEKIEVPTMFPGIFAKFDGPIYVKEDEIGIVTNDIPSAFKEMFKEEK